MHKINYLLTMLCLLFFSCNSSAEKQNVISYEKNYEFVIDVPGKSQKEIYDSISFWLNSEFNTDRINVPEFNSNNRDSGIFAYSLKNIGLTELKQVGPFGGWWESVDIDFLIQTKPEKYKITFKNISIYKTTVNGYGVVLEKKRLTKVKEQTLKNLNLFFEKKAFSLKTKILEINQDW